MNHIWGVSCWDQRWANPNGALLSITIPMEKEAGSKKEAFLFVYLAIFSSFTPRMELVVLCIAHIGGMCGFSP